MVASKLLQLVKDDDLESFETLCLEAAEDGSIALADVAAAFAELERRSKTERAATLGQMILETVDPQSDPPAAQRIARVALLGDPKNEDLRQRLVELYRQAHGDRPGLETLLEMSGLTTGRPARNAIRVLDVCLPLKPGDALISRMEGVVAEVLGVDAEHGLITLRQQQRSTTIPPAELAQAYERVAADDFRVLRALKPDHLTELLQSDPVRVVIGLIHAHGEALHQDMLKRDLVPKYIPAGEWTKWWSKARTELQRSPHVVIEGRSPVLLRYTEEAVTLEDATWEAFQEQHDPVHWLTTFERYLREKKAHKEQPDSGLLARCRSLMDRHCALIQDRRPSEALATLLVAERLQEIDATIGDDATAAAMAMLRDSREPVALVAGQADETLWSRALQALVAARPDDGAARAVELMPVAPAGALDQIVEAARQAGVLELVNTHVDTALADPVDYPEIVYWLWKGPKARAGLSLPADDDLFTNIVQTLSALGRTLHPEVEVGKRFRHRMRTAFALRDYERVAECIRRTPADRAVTLRSQLTRMEGLGDNAPSKMLSLLREVHPDLWKVTRERPALWADPNVLWNTAAGIKRKTDERDELVNVKMHENAKRIGEAASHGDLSENSEYKFALEERDFLRARLAQMNNDLSLAEAIEPHIVPADHVGVGSRVTVRNVGEGTVQDMTFLGPFDADVDRGLYNYRAPLAQHLMGARVGEKRTVVINDLARELEVLAIASGLTGGGESGPPRLFED